jgi:CzcA family heavy metal efflux pump
MSLGQFIGRHRTAILGLCAMLVAAGGWAAATMPVAIFPEVAFHRITVIAHSGNLPVEQTLTAVTQPLENAFAGVLGVEIIRSRTTLGGTEIDLTFGWKSDMLRALQLVQAAMEEVRPSLPPDSRMEARLLDTSAFPIVGVAVTSRQRTLAELSDFVIYEATPQLRTIPGVYRVELNGAKVREYALTVDPERLVAHRLELETVEKAVREANVIVAGGQVRDGYHLVLTVVHGAGARTDTLTDIVVAEDKGTPVRLGDVARVESALREDFTRAAANGEVAALIGVSRQPTGNAVVISNGVRERIAALERAHPDYTFSVFYDQADLVHDSIASVRDSIAIGLILAVATIFFFIADVRSTLVAAAVIPATVLISCIALRALGMTFNLMTLGGIAAGIGLIIDDAIVVMENFDRHRALGQADEDVLGASMGEIAHALVGSTLTPVVVLLPLGFLGGVAGAFFRPLAVTMSVALVVSLALALTFTPALASAFERASRRPVRPSPGDRLAHSLVRFYTRGLGWTLEHAWTAAVVGVGFVALAWVAYRHVETGFIPGMDEGAFVLDYWAPPGTSLDETVHMLETVDAILGQTPEVTAFARRTGSELGFFLTETNQGDYSVRLRRGRRRSIEDVMEDVREQIHARLPGLRVEFIQILQDMIGDLSGTPNPVELKLFGTEQVALERTAPVANRVITKVDGIVDTFDGITEVGPTYRIEVDEQRAKRVGLSATAVQAWLETAITGGIVGQVLEGDRAVPLRLRYPDAIRTDMQAVQDLTLVTPGATLAPLSALARLGPGPVAVERTRENLRQLVRVTARLEGRDLGSATRAVQDALARDLVLPAGVSLEYGGLYGSQRQAFRELVAVFFAALACVLALLLIEFGSVAAALAIVIGSSLALSGSLGALWATGTALNVSSIVGMIMVVGIVAKNGILLLDFAGRGGPDASDLTGALVRAGSVRLRPILMTSLAAIAGLAPLAFGIGAGGQMQQPLAIAILGGVSLAMLFSLIGVPLLYLLLGRLGRTVRPPGAT